MTSPMLRTLVLGLLLAAAVAAQERRPDSRRPAGEPPAAEAERVDPMVEAWVRTLVRRLGTRNRIIRASVQAALVEVGRPAVPTLERVAREGARREAAAARDVLRRIKTRDAREDRGGRGRGGRDGDRGGRSWTLRALEKVDLKEGQERRVREVHGQFLRRLRDLYQARMDDELDRAEFHKARWEAYKELNDSLRGILAPAQYRAYMKEIRKIRRMHKRRGSDDDGRRGKRRDRDEDHRREDHDRGDRERRDRDR